MAANKVPTIQHPTNRPNLTEVSTPDVTITYSYETPIGFEVRGLMGNKLVARRPADATQPGATSTGAWANTTAKHVHRLKARGFELVDWSEFATALERVTR